MRTVPVILTSAVLGIALGCGVTWARYGLAVDTWRLMPKWRAPSGPPPKVAVDREDFDFGSIERDSTVRHLFRFTNVGGGTLHLEKLGTSCGKCTISDLKQDTVAPGETVEVAVEYHASLPLSVFDFKQTATIGTTDPERPRVELHVAGKIISAFHMAPPDIVFSKVRIGETTTGEVNLYGLLETPVQVDGFEWSDAEAAKFFDVKFVPIPKEELQDPDAKSGQRVMVTIKPGLPLGTVTQRLRLKTNLAGAPDLTVPIFAKIESDISIAGPPAWNAEKNMLSFGVVKSSAGASRKLQIQLLGPERHDVRFAVEQVVPDFLKVTIGEPSEANKGESVRIPLTIEIPPGSPAANYLGSQQAKLGEVLLSTTHSQAKQLKLSVRFAVDHE